MIQKKNYRKTLHACYLGFITQAIAANFAPLLFLQFHRVYAIPLGQIALIPAVFYITQLIVDVSSAKFADKIGYRVCAVASEAVSVIGLIGLAFLPELLPVPFAGILISVMIYAVGSGLIEVLVNPIVEACPFEHKESVMSLLHSFYCWGSVAVILGTTVFFRVFGIENWKWMACIWALIPLYNIYNFMVCPIELLVEDGKGMSIGKLFRTPVFLTGIVLMICAGAAEMSMAQWASAFCESALGISKSIGDLAGPCGFAVMMGLSRLIYGKTADRIPLTGYMTGSGILCLVCYILAGLTHDPLPGLIGCMFCGFSVGIMWPGTISLLSKALPAGGTAMFALLAMAGDTGGSIGPALIGMVSQQANDDLHAGLFAGSVFPLVLIAAMLVFLGRTRRPGRQTGKPAEG